MVVVSHGFRPDSRTAPAHERQTPPGIRAITLPIGIAAHAFSHPRSRRPTIIIALLSAGLTGSFLPASAQCTPPIELIASDRLANDQFGEAVAISGDTAVVGAPNHHDPATSSIGAAYIFVRNGAGWNQQAKLVVPGDTYSFGAQVAISGNTLAVTNYSGPDSYVFTRSGANWTQQADLTDATDQFTNVALSPLGTQRLIAAVGAQFATVNGVTLVGAVHIFTLNTLQVGSVWTDVARLTAPDGAYDDQFGAQVGLSGGFAGATLIVTAPQAEVAGLSRAGAAYVFTSNSFGGGWTFQAKLTAAMPHADEYFGFYGASVSGDTAVITTLNNALVYVFTRSGTTWMQGQILPPPPGFGPYSARISGNSLLLGLESPDTPATPETGPAALFTRPVGSGTGGIWTQHAVLTPPAGAASGEFAFGRADLSQNHVVLGNDCQIGNGNPGTTYPSSAYIFDVSRQVCPPDFNCSGTITVQDIFDFLAAWFAGDPRADFNGVNGIAVQDIFDFLAAWFAGC